MFFFCFDFCVYPPTRKYLVDADGDMPIYLGAPNPSPVEESFDVFANFIDGILWSYKVIKWLIVIRNVPSVQFGGQMCELESFDIERWLIRFEKW